LIRADKIPVAGTEVVQSENGLDVNFSFLNVISFSPNFVQVNVDREPNCNQRDISGSSSSDATIAAVDVSQTLDIIEPESVPSTSADRIKRRGGDNG